VVTSLKPLADFGCQKNSWTVFTIGHLPGANGRASCRRDVLEGDVHFVSSMTLETDPVGVGAVTTSV
jgi:hypothetical protein